MGSLEALAGQAYGKGKFYLLGVYLNRGRVLYMLMAFPSLLVMLYSTQIMNILGFDKELIPLTSSFIKALIPAFIFSILFEVERRFIQAQGQFTLPMIITLITLLLHPIFCYLFIYTASLGMVGAAYSQSLISLLNFIFLHIYISYNQLSAEGSWFWPNQDTYVFSDCTYFMKVSLWCAGMAILEWWGYELLNIQASYMGVVQLSICVVILNISNLYYMFPMGLASVLGVTVGKYIANSEISKAKFYVKIGIFLNFLVCLCECILLAILRKYIPRIYTDQREVIEGAEEILFIIAFLSISDGFLGAAGGVVRGLGQQNLATYGFFVSYYPLLQPLALFFGFTCGWQVKGLYIAVIITSYLLSAYIIYIIYRKDWKEISKNVKERINQEEMVLMQKEQII